MTFKSRDQVESEIRACIASDPKFSIEKIAPKMKFGRGRLPIWLQTSTVSLRLNDLGFELYSLVEKPHSFSFKLSMSSRRILEMSTVLHQRVWYYSRKYSPTTHVMTHTINCWDPAVTVNWYLSGEDWDTWIQLCR